jgi:hypothetical protein
MLRNSLVDVDFNSILSKPTFDPLRNNGCLKITILKYVLIFIL